MKSRAFPIMPDLNRGDWNKKNVLLETIVSTVSPLRLIGLAFILGNVVNSLAIPGLATLGIFGWSGLLAIASVGFTALVEKNLRIPGKTLEWVLYIVITSLGTISIEFTGILAHSATFLLPDHSMALFWDNISIVLFVGGFCLSAFQSYAKRFIGVQVDERTKMLFVVFMVPAITALLWIVYCKILPMTYFHP